MASEPIVAVLLPVLDSMPGRCVECLTEMMIASEAAVKPKTSVGSRLLDKCRNGLVEWALKGPYTHFMFIDSDMTYPPDALNRLLAHGLDVVGCAYVSRGAQPVPYLFGDFEEDGQVRIKAGAVLNAGANGPGGVIAVGALAGGFFLASRVVFEILSSPWFKFVDDLVGEDLYFSRLCRKAGISLSCDLALSEEIGHIGQDERRLGMFRAWATTPTGKLFMESNRGIMEI